MDKPNCYACRFRGDIPGDCHSTCRHPATNNQTDEPFVGLVMMLTNFSAGKPPAGSRELGITANPHGIRMGWFLWPYNYDPAWLLSCKGFESKAEASQQSSAA